MFLNHIPSISCFISPYDSHNISVDVSCADQSPLATWKSKRFLSSSKRWSSLRTMTPSSWFVKPSKTTMKLTSPGRNQRKVAGKTGKTHENGWRLLKKKVWQCDREPSIQNEGLVLGKSGIYSWGKYGKSPSKMEVLMGYVVKSNEKMEGVRGQYWEIPFKCWEIPYSWHFNATLLAQSLPTQCRFYLYGDGSAPAKMVR